MIFDKWIVWDALSTPAGKLMPAHYSILHFIKYGGNKKINSNIEQIPHKDYCLRSSCVKKRETVSQVKVTDIWKDCHRVKHNKNKNDHPCQLPIKLLDRIITKYSSDNDRIFDPFGGTGSAAVSAKINDRRFTITDIDQKYCEIANKNIDRVLCDENGINRYVLEPSITPTTKKSNYNSKKVEETYMELCSKENSILEIQNLIDLDIDLYYQLQNYPKSFKKLQSMTKRLKSQTFGM
jgi:site-specific DNA-methyltransferase (adenine-specific)